jgi:hypothetical protein
MILSIIFYFFSTSTFSHIIQDKISVVEKKNFSFKYVCDKSFSTDSPLIEALSSIQLDCMGRKINVSDYCEKEFLDHPYYLRAYIDRNKNEVICLMGKRVLIKFVCAKLKDQKFCSMSPQNACLEIRKKLAKSLNIVHASFIKNEKSLKQLNCFYESL